MYLLSFLNKKRIGIVLLLVSFSVLGNAQSVQLSVSGSVDSSSINTGNIFIYTVNYSVSSLTTNGQNVVATIQLPDLLRPADTVNFNNSVSFDDDQISSMVYSGGLITINFVNPIPAGSTGQLQIRMRYANGITPDGYAPDLITSIDATNNINPDLSTGPVLSNTINVVAKAHNHRTVSKTKTAGGGVDDQAIYRINLNAPSSSNGALFLYNPIVVDTLPLGMDFVEATSFSGSNEPVYDPLNRTVTWTWPSSPFTVNYTSLAYLIVKVTSPTYTIGSTVTNDVYLFGENPALPLGTFVNSQKKGTYSFTLAAASPGGACNGGGITAATASWLNKHILAGTTCNTFSNGWYNSGNTVLDSIKLTYTVDEAIDMSTIYVRPVYDGLNRVDTATIQVFYNTNLSATFVEVGTYASEAIALLSGSRLLLPITLPMGEYIKQVRFIVKGGIPLGATQNLAYCGDARTDVQNKKDGTPLTEGITYNPSSPGDDGTLVNNSSEGSYFYNNVETTYSGCNGVAEIMYEQPIFGFTAKTITNGTSNFRASDTIYYRIQTFLGGNVPATDVFFSDTLDSRLSYVPGSSNFLIDNVPTAITPTISGNILTWNITPPPLAVNKNYAITFRAVIAPGTLAANIPNRGVLGSSNALFNTVTSNVNATVITSVALRAYKGQSGCDLDYVYYPNFAIAQEGGPVNYKITIKNLGNISSKDFVLVDAFPFIGDARGSQWFANLVSAVSISDPSATVYYTTTPNPCYSDMVPPSFPPSCNTPLWTLTPPVDITSVKGIKITRTNPMAPLDSIELTWKMRAPVGTPVGYLMNNSVIYQAKRADNNSQLLPATPNLVGMYTNCTPVLGSLGNYAWIDANRNGLQDEAPSSGLNGVKVYLYGAGLNGVIGGGDDILLDSTITANDFFGNPGYYKFVELASGNYYVQFETLFNQYKITPVNDQTAKVDFNNDANRTTGLSGLVIIDASGSGQDKHNTTIDAGYYPTGTIGNYVWFDANENGLQDEPTQNGLNGIKVYLYKFNGLTFDLVDSAITSNNGGNPGYYNFIIEESGTYRVKFPTGGSQTLTSQTITSGTDLNSDADQATGFSPNIVMNVFGSGVSKNNPTIDAGYLCNTVIADFDAIQVGCCGEIEIQNNSLYANGFEWKCTSHTGNFFYVCNDSTETFNLTLAPGTYDIMLIATNHICNLSDTAFKTITVLPKAQAVFAYDVNSCGLNAAFRNYSFDATQYTWNFGDPASGVNNASTLENPVHTFSAPGTYQVSLVASNGTTCHDTLVREIIIQPASGILPTASFTQVGVTPSCAAKIRFSSTSTNASSLFWIFHDGTTSNLSEINKTYPLAGSYQVKLVAISSTNCTDTATQTVNILSNSSGSQALFSVNDSVQCLVGNAFNFINNSIYHGIGWNANYYWDFGDGTIDHSNTFIYNKKYSTSGLYRVRLVAKSGWGCYDTTYQMVYVKPSPTASFIVSNTCDLNVHFTNTSTNTLASNWDLGDNSTLCEDTLQFDHNYYCSGWYAPKLITVGENGCYDSTSRYINPIRDSIPTALFNYDTVSCAQSIYFNNLSSPGAYIWNFGDGSPTSNDQFPTHGYTSAGTYNVSLTVQKAFGCSTSYNMAVNAPASNGTLVPKGKFGLDIEPCTNTIFATSNSVNASGLKWIFDGSLVGTGTNLQILNPSIGAHLLALVASNGTCHDTFYQHIQIQETPTAGFDFEVSTCSNTVLFVSTSKNATNFVWDFGDAGNTTASYSSQAAHSFSADGTYQVKLIALNLHGCSDTITLPVTVNQGNNPNIARFAIDNAWCQNCHCNNKVEFTNLTNGVGNSYLWSFGDGTTSTAVSPQKGFPHAGTFNVTLSVNNGSGCINSTTKQVTIPSQSTGPSASFYTDQYIQCISNQSFNFYNTSTYMGAGWGKRYYWDFGDGTVDTINSFIFNKTYAVPGDYVVRLVMLGSDGCYDTMSTRISVKALPCTGVIFYLSNLSDLKDAPSHIGGGIKMALGLNEGKEDALIDFTLYPNPSSGEINLTFSNTIKGETTISIIDVLGREVFFEQRNLAAIQTLTINELQVTNGTYYVIIKNENGFMGRKQVTIIK